MDTGHTRVLRLMDLSGRCLRRLWELEYCRIRESLDVGTRMLWVPGRLTGRFAVVHRGARGIPSI